MSRRPSRTHTVTDAHTERTAKNFEERVGRRIGGTEWGLVSGIQELGKTGLRSGLVAR